MKKQEFFIDCEGEKLHCIQWTPDSSPALVLQIVHGMVEYIDRYDELATYLCSRGIAVVGHDQPGHGMTAPDSASLGYIREKDGSLHLARCAMKVCEYIKDTFPNVKNFILGHSMGSFVVRRILTSDSERFSGAIIVGTGEPPRAALKAGKALATLIGKICGFRHRSRLLTSISFAGYNSRFDKSEGIHAWISSDRDVVSKYDADPFCSYTFTAGGFLALYDTLLYISDRSSMENIRKDLPILITAGKEDPVGDYGKSPRSYFEYCRSIGISDVSLLLYDGQRHEVINERERKTVHKDTADWLISKI